MRKTIQAYENVKLLMQTETNIISDDIAFTIHSTEKNSMLETIIIWGSSEKIEMVRERVRREYPNIVFYENASVSEGKYISVNNEGWDELVVVTVKQNGEHDIKLYSSMDDLMSLLTRKLLNAYYAV